MSAVPPIAATSLSAAPPSPARELWRDFRRNRGAVIGLAVLGLLVFCALFANVISPYDPSEQFRDATLRPPSLAPVGGHVFVLGTDPVGRDILSRLIHGTRLSLVIGLVSVGLSLSVGVLLGLVAGFSPGRWPEYAVMRLMDVMLALPSLLLAVAVVAVLGPGLASAMFAIAIVMLPHFVRLTRGAVLGELAKDYVQASRLAGAGTARLMFDTVLPNCAAPLIVQATLGFSSAILDAAALGFLGLGAQPPTPEWGSMLASALEFIQSAWWVVTLPGLANAMFAIAIVMLPHFVRLTRGAVLGELAKDYVQASRLAGAGTARLMFDTVLPNCAAPLIVQATLGFSSAILDAAALGFLGLGAQPPTPEWGSMLASALEFIQSAWWVVTLPGLAILITVLAFNLTGDGLRDALDPKLKT